MKSHPISIRSKQQFKCNRPPDESRFRLIDKLRITISTLWFAMQLKKFKLKFYWELAQFLLRFKLRLTTIIMHAGPRGVKFLFAPGKRTGKGEKGRKNSKRQGKKGWREAKSGIGKGKSVRDSYYLGEIWFWGGYGFQILICRYLCHYVLIIFRLTIMIIF